MEIIMDVLIEPKVGGQEALIPSNGGGYSLIRKGGLLGSCPETLAQVSKYYWQHSRLDP